MSVLLEHGGYERQPVVKPHLGVDIRIDEEYLHGYLLVELGIWFNLKLS